MVEKSEEFVPTPLMDETPTNGVIDTTKGLRRGRGRPKLTDQQKAENAAKRASSARKAPAGRAPRRGRVSSLEKDIAARLVLINFALMLTPFAGDVLDEAEITVLARSIDSQARASTQFAKYLKMALTVSAGGDLLGVVAMIGARRASRHGLLPENYDAAIGSMLAMQAGITATPEMPTEQVVPTE